MDTSVPPSPHNGVLTLVQNEPDWQPIFHASNQVVLYNPTSHALSIRRSSTSSTDITPSSCPFCKRPLPAGYSLREEEEAEVDEILDTENDDARFSRATNYFQLLAIANDTMSRPSSPPSIAASSSGESAPTFSTEALAEGYFNAFFKEERRLGMGANGSVYLCQHRLDGNPLGYFAVKKIAVGQSHSYLVKILREVRLLERLHHRNIITYHHAWLETYQFSPFGPKVPTLHVLMEWADGGSLDDFIDARLGRPTKHIHIHPVTPVARPTGRNSVPPSRRSSLIGNSRSHFDHMDSDLHSRSARIRAFRAYQRATPAEKEAMKRQTESSHLDGGSRTTWTPVHLLSPEEIKSLFSDVVSGLAFLHDRSILHLDLKPGNVLLTWDEGSLIPRAMLSDFGTSRDMLQTSPTRSGNTGTLEYTSPESLPSPTTGLLQQVDSKADMWSLGMILHKLLFFKLPYRYAAIGDSNGEPVSGVDEHEKMDRLEKEILGYAGFKPNQDHVASFEARRLPRAFLVLLESLLSITPSGRPSSERVSNAIREGKLDPLQQTHPTSLVSVTPRLSNVPASRLSSVQSDAEPHTGVDTREHSTDAPLTEAQANTHSQSPNEKSPVVLGIPPHQANRSGAVSPPYDRASPSRIPSLLIKRTVKSSLLVAKVLHVTTLCPHSQLHIVPLSIILSAAVIDTWFDNYWITALFGAFHLAAVKAASHNNFGCV